MGSGRALENAIKKHGIKNFKRCILQSFKEKDQAYKREREIVNEEFVKRADTYNMKVGGIGGFSDKLYWLGRHHSPETIEKCRLANIGKIFSQETKKKMSQAKKGKTTWNKDISPSQKTRALMSKNRKGKLVGKDNPFYGKKHSQQILIKLRKPKSEQTKEKMKNSRTYNHHSQQTKQKISKSLREYYSKQKNCGNRLIPKGLLTNNTLGGGG